MLCIAGGVVAQFQGRRGSQNIDPANIERGNIPRWDVDKQFPTDVFRFARVRYTTAGSERSSRAWWTDFPDADLNISWRLSQLTSMKVDPDPVVVDLTDEALFDYPFVFMSGAIRIVLSEAEVVALRRYLRNGGFLMVDDFWGEENWDYFYSVIKQVLPESEAEELALEHPIFNCVFKLTEKPQIPNVFAGTRSRETGITWEVEDGKVPHYRGMFDANRRMMVLICHNTDLGDGWEEEATDPYYFKEFSEKKAYPLGINIIYYVMTH